MGLLAPGPVLPGAEQSWVGGTESKAPALSLSPAAPVKLRDSCQGKEDLHQQSKDKRWLLASGKFSSFFEDLGPGAGRSAA